MYGATPLTRPNSSTARASSMPPDTDADPNGEAVVNLAPHGDGVGYGFVRKVSHIIPATSASRLRRSQQVRAIGDGGPRMRRMLVEQPCQQQQRTFVNEPEHEVQRRRTTKSTWRIHFSSRRCASQNAQSTVKNSLCTRRKNKKRSSNIHHMPLVFKQLQQQEFEMRVRSNVIDTTKMPSEQPFRGAHLESGGGSSIGWPGPNTGGLRALWPLRVP